jgi:hypothetical protein
MHRLWRQCLEALWSLVAFMAVLAYTAILLWTPVPKRRGKNQA